MELFSQIIRKSGILSISDKQVLLLKKTYRQITQQFYEDSSEFNANIIIDLNSLLIQTTSNKGQTQKLTSILSILQILKIKCKSLPILYQSVLRTIDHLKNPKQNKFNFKTVLACCENVQLFSIGCTFAYLFYSKLIKSQNLDWKQLILQIGKYPSINAQMSLQLLNIICKDNQGNSKNIVKSGFVKFIISCYLQQKINDKFLLYRALKFLKHISIADRSIIKQRQRPLAHVVFKHQDYIIILEQLCNKCYDEQYCTQIYSKNKYQTSELDLTYVWSFNSTFSKNIPQKNIKQLLRVVQLPNITSEMQTKIYCILNNITKFTNINFEKILQISPKSSQALYNYLKLIVSSLQNDNQLYKKVNFVMLQKLVSNDSNVKCQKMLEYIQSMQNKQKKINTLNSKLIEMFSQKNAYILLQKAGKIPKNNEQLRVLKQILNQKQLSNNQFQKDVFYTVQNKALQSISNSVIQKNNIDLNVLVKELQFNNIYSIAKILKIIQVGIMMQHFQSSNFDRNKIIQMIQYIENYYDGQLIDWQSITQILLIFQGQQAWKTHFNQIPKRCFWLLGSTQFNQKQFQFLLNGLNKIFDTKNQRTYKYSLIIGFLGKVLTRQQKVKFINKFFDQFINIGKQIKKQINWKINLYMISLFLHKWHDIQNQESNNIFQKIISSTHQYILNNFKSSEHQYKFLQSCLPYKLPAYKLVENIDFLLSEYGKLASYIYQNSNPKPILNYDKISNLTNNFSKDKQNIIQIITFLKNNNNIIQGQQIIKLFYKLIQNPQTYWQLYPNFVQIIKSVLQIIEKSDNYLNIKNLTQIIQDLIKNLQLNKQITQDQKNQILNQLIKNLKKLSQKGIYLDIDRLKRITNKIQNQQIQTQILYILNNYKIQQNNTEKQKHTKRTLNQLNNQQSFSNLNNHQNENQKQKTNDRNFMTNANASTSKNKLENQKNNQNQNQKQHLWIDQKQKNKVQSEINKLQSIEPEKSKNQLTVLAILKKIKKMNQKKTDTSEFPMCIQVIRQKQLVPNQKDILGHLLVKFYNIQKNKQVIQMLLNKQKTNLSKQMCYQIISKNIQTFVLSERWKLIGRQWLDISIQRMSQGFFSAACQVAEYNLIKVQDLHYFYNKAYHKNVIKNMDKITNEQEAIYYLLLIGTSARLADVKKCYIKDKLHLTILNYIEKWSASYRLTANLFYALSSLVYVQPQICLEIAKKQSPMKKLLNNFRQFYDSRAVIESGGCFIANMAYSNDQVKQILRTYGVIQKMVYVFKKNLQDPQISTFKQLLRGFGNLSLAQKCARQITDLGFSQLQVSMIQTFNMFVNLDENKLKLLKVAIDVLANLCSHKYKLNVMHSQNVTGTIIMLLQTVDLNPPIIMGCIDTVDGLCQNAQIQAFAVQQRKLPYILIDILKIQQDQKIIVKATRLLTNLTINPKNIPFILEANLLSVLASIVMPSFFMKFNKNSQNNYLSNNPNVSSAPNSKMQVYINKILVRINNAKPNFKLLLKSGYLDCLVRTIQTADNLQDAYIDILGSYAKILPNFLNKRAFMCLIRVLTRKIKSKEIIQKCLIIFKILLLRSYDRDQQDIVIEDSPKMYEKMLEQYKVDTLFILGLHTTISSKLRKLLLSTQKQFKIIPILYQLSQIQEYQDLANSVLFSLFKQDQKSKKPIVRGSQEQSMKILKQGFICQLYRIDGSSKKAKIMMTQDQNIVAFKYPGGQIKNKYTLSLKTIRDWQFDYQKNDKQWQYSVFSKNKGIFSTKASPENCSTIIGGLKWGQVAYINVSFNSKQDKQKFKNALSTMIFAN